MTWLRDNMALLAGIVFTTSTIIVFLVLAFTGWTGGPAPCIEEGNCYCESFTPGDPIAQPANTWSCLAYVVAGLVMCHALDRDRRVSGYLPRDPLLTGQPHRMFGPNPFAMSYALAAMAIGPGSMFFHGSMVSWGGLPDILSMVAYMSFVLLMVLHQATPVPARVFFTTWIVMNVFAIVLMTIANELWAVLFGSIMGSAIILEIIFIVLRWNVGRRQGTGTGKASRAGPRPRWFLVTMISLVAAFITWFMGADASSFCDPNSPWQWHVAWHVLTALATWFLFRYFRSSTPASGSRWNVPDVPASAY